MSDTGGIYNAIESAIQKLFAAGFTRKIPVYWRTDDLDPMPDVAVVPLFMRNEVDFGAERVLAFGGGQFKNLRGQFGSVVLRAYASRAAGTETFLLATLGEAMACFRSQRVVDILGNTLSFIGEGSGFRGDPTEDGNWFLRGSLMIYQYRFSG